MGRRIEMKKIQDNTKCQVSFSKRRSSLIKKVEEISIICDVDVAFIAFSPAGRISKFCNRERIVDFLDLYVNLPAEKRISHMKNVQEKMGKLQALGIVGNEDGKLQYLNNQIQNLKLLLERNQREVQLAEANLRDFELNPMQEASLHQLSWCERNLQNCIKKVKEIKNEKILMENEGTMPCLYNQSGSNQLQMQFEYWRNNQYGYPENIFSEMLGKGKGKEIADNYGAPKATVQNNTFNASIPTSSGLHQFVVPETQTWLSCASLPNNAYDAIHQPGNAPMPWPHAESSSFPFGKFAGESSNFRENYSSSYPTGFTASDSNNVTNSLADPCWEIPMVENQPNLVLGHTDVIDANSEGNGIYNKEVEDTYKEMILSSPPPVQAPPPTSGVPTDLYKFLPCEDPLGDLSLTQKIEVARMRDWDNLNF